MFNGILIEKDELNGYQARLKQIDDELLGQGDVLVQVYYSGLNYKDALAITGQSPVVRQFPMIPGIDFSGVVLKSSHSDWQAGDEVILNGWGVGEKFPGGLAEIAQVSGDWLIRKPQAFSFQQAMAIGTAGYTAMLCVIVLENHGITPHAGEILVTGANGGVGSIAIAILKKLGYQVVASTGRMQDAKHLYQLGASAVIDRAELSGQGKPLQKEHWAGVIDTVGSHTLANACASTQYRGAVAACGLAGGMDFPATVAPFILRGITLYGIDSVMAPKSLREQAWQRLAQDLDSDKLAALTTEITLQQCFDVAHKILDGQVRGRTVVKIS